MVRGQPKGTTRGVIVPHESLPRALLVTGNHHVIHLHSTLINEYLAHVKRTAWWQREHSFATVGMYTAFFYRCLGDRLFREQQLSPKALVQLYETSHRGQNLKNSTYVEHCRRLVVLGTLLFRLGIMQGETAMAHSSYVQTFFAARMQSPTLKAQESRNGKEFTPAEVDRLYASCCNRTEYALLMLLLTTGLRIGGAVNLRVAGVQNPDGTIKSVGTTTEKGAAQHVIFLCPVLRHWLGCHITTAVFVFPARYSKQEPCSVGHLQHMFRKLCQRAQITGPHNVHRTRHTLAHALRLTGAPGNHIQRMLGHACPRTTDLYGALNTYELVQNMHLPWDGVEDDLQTRDSSALLQSLCPPFSYHLPWMTQDDTAALRPTGPARSGDIPRGSVPVGTCDLVQLLSKLVRHGKKVAMETPIGKLPQRHTGAPRRNSKP